MFNSLCGTLSVKEILFRILHHLDIYMKTIMTDVYMSIFFEIYNVYTITVKLRMFN